ncbi:hypothetical protein FRC06_011875 [Ceratobasidium sp. 370]|nr:hypothetical protein FRC06_011875 [Ceratobasidium sp. 370]
MKSTTRTVFFAALLALATPRHARAHGIVTRVQVGGITYNGLKPGSTVPNNSPIRGVTDQSPLKDLQSNDMICGMGATPGTVVASAKPGDNLVYTWGNVVAEDGHWIHDTGPMMTYMAQVPTGKTADTFDGVGAKWFKTGQVGKKNNKWVQASLMTGATFTTQIPETLADGDYLVRHEIIALHNAGSKNGAEFYPSCLQLRIQNSNAGKAIVTASPTVSFPGAYTATDPGILVDVFSQAADGSEYKFPAGPIANVSAPGATGNPPNAVADENSTSSAATSTSSTVPAKTNTASTTSAASTSTPATITLTSASSAPTTTSAAPSATPSDLAAVRLANGRKAQELNLRFKTLSVSDKCEPREPGCIDGEFAVCTLEGTWSKQGACFTGTSCFAVPLTNTNGTQVGCFPKSVVEQAIIDSGAGRAIVTGTTSSAPLSTQSSTSTRASLATTSVPASITTIVPSTVTPTSTPVVSPTSSSPLLATNTISSTTAAPSITPVKNNSGAPAVVIGVGSKPARRMLRWERPPGARFSNGIRRIVDLAREASKKSGAGDDVGAMKDSQRMAKITMEMAMNALEASVNQQDPVESLITRRLAEEKERRKAERTRERARMERELRERDKYWEQEIERVRRSVERRMVEERELECEWQEAKYEAKRRRDEADQRSIEQAAADAVKSAQEKAVMAEKEAELARQEASEARQEAIRERERADDAEQSHKKEVAKYEAGCRLLEEQQELAAWSRYESQWRLLKRVSTVVAGGDGIFRFEDIPWPTVVPPASPSAITPEEVATFLFSGPLLEGMTLKSRIKDCLLRWHPDKFSGR